MKTISYTVDHNLCTGCGVCKGICPVNCITWQEHQGLFLPSVQKDLCLHCGLCFSICPGISHHYIPRESALDTITGSVLATYNAWSRNPHIRHISASGGVVSTIIHRLLVSEYYDGAFCVDSYDYHTQLNTRLYTVQEIAAHWPDSSMPKSRYLPVSHEAAILFMKTHREKKLILVATSCALRAIKAAIEKLHLNPDNYLLIGLFCDKVFTYHVLPYLEKTYAHGQKLTALHFKNKESGGWPGDMKLYPENHVPFFIPLSQRTQAKPYFMPEKCLYCVDKLNVQADISLGDNYTEADTSAEGSNSVIIRTEKGLATWKLLQNDLETRTISIQAIQKAQYLDGRLNNLYFGDLKSQSLDNQYNLNIGIPREQNAADYTYAWKLLLKRLHAGACYISNPNLLRKQMRSDHQHKNALFHVFTRLLHRLKQYINHIFS